MSRQAIHDSQPSWMVHLLMICAMLTMTAWATPAVETVMSDGMTFHVFRLASSGIVDIQVTDRDNPAVSSTVATLRVLDAAGQPTEHTIMVSCFGRRQDGLVSMIPLGWVAPDGSIPLSTETTIGDPGRAPVAGVTPADRKAATWSLPTTTPITIWVRLRPEDLQRLHMP